MWFWEGTSFWQGRVSVGKMLYPHNYFWTPSSVFTLFLFSGLGFMPVASFFLVPWCFIAHLSQSYELKEEKGLSATMNTVWRKLNQPFQPHIPQLQQQSRTKFLSHSFSRDKLHLWETSGDNWGGMGWWVDWYLLRFLCVPKAPEQLKNINPDSFHWLHRSCSALLYLSCFRYNISCKDTFFDNATRSRIVSSGFL